MAVTLQNITKYIGKAKILDDISMVLESGRAYGFAGKNGSGKTMLMRCISGLMKPTNGTVTIDDKLLWKDISFPESIGMLLEAPAFIPSLTGYQNLCLLANIQKHISSDEIRQTLLDVGLDPNDKRKFRKYSLGMKQRLGIAAAFMENPKLIILDEPINALDFTGVEKIRTLIQRHKERNALIIVACHDKEELELLADEIFFWQMESWSITLYRIRGRMPNDRSKKTPHLAYGICGCSFCRMACNVYSHKSPKPRCTDRTVLCRRQIHFKESRSGPFGF